MGVQTPDRDSRLTYIKSIVYLGPLNEENQTHRLVKNTVLYGLKCNLYTISGFKAPEVNISCSRAELTGALV